MGTKHTHTNKRSHIFDAAVAKKNWISKKSRSPRRARLKTGHSTPAKRTLLRAHAQQRRDLPHCQPFRTPRTRHAFSLVHPNCYASRAFSLARTTATRLLVAHASNMMRVVAAVQRAARASKSLLAAAVAPPGESETVSAARIAADATAQASKTTGTISFVTTVSAAVIGVVSLLLAAHYTGRFAIDAAKVPSEASEKQDRELAAVAAGVELRLLDGIKARILQPKRPPAFQPPQAGEASVCRRILPLERAAASALFKELEQEYPIDIVIAPKVSS